MIFLPSRMTPKKNIAPITREERMGEISSKLKGMRITIQRKLEKDSTLSPVLKTRPFPAITFSK